MHDTQRQREDSHSTVSRRRPDSVWLRVLLCLVVVAGVVAIGAAFVTTLSTAQASEPGDVGYRDFSYGEPNGSCSSNPTAEKPESKLWFADGSWWGSLCDDEERAYFIYRLDLASQSWIKTEAKLDTRSKSRADMLWDDDNNKLYFVSHLVQEGGAPSPVDRDWGRIYRYDYDPSTDTYSPDPLHNEVTDKDFEYVNNGKSETLTLAKDSTGQLWVTYTMSDSVYVNRSLGDDATWGEPFVISDNGTTATNLTDDDISSIIAFEDKSTGQGYIGVMWSNQNENAFYFAVHPDSSGDTADWTIVSAYAGPNVAEDHINLKSLHADDAGNVFAVVKTNISNPVVALLACNAGSNCTSSGDWQAATVYRKSGDLDPTRPMMLIDEENRDLYVFITTPESGGEIYYKSSSIDTIDFGDPTAFGMPFIRSSQDPAINNPTSTKQNLTSETGLVVLASDSSTKYYLHNFMCLGGNCPWSVEFAQTNYEVNEDAGTATIDVTLSQATPNTVTVQYEATDGTATDGADYEAVSGSLIFPPGETNRNFAVPIIDDDIDEADETINLTLSNANNASLGDNSSATLTILDDDTAGVSVSPTTISATEGGATGSYSVVLTSEPTADVTVAVNAGAEVTVDPSSLTFTPANWDQPQEVTVTAVDDEIVDGAHSETIDHTVSSSDPNYDGISAASVTVNINDNDSPGVSISPTTLNLSAGSSATYSVVLNTEPAANVTVDISAGAGVTVNPTSLTFTPSNWDQPQQVEVSLGGDVKGEQSVTISHTVSSSDPDYNGVSVDSVTVAVVVTDTSIYLPIVTKMP